MIGFLRWQLCSFVQKKAASPQTTQPGHSSTKFRWPRSTTNQFGPVACRWAAFLARTGPAGYGNADRLAGGERRCLVGRTVRCPAWHGGQQIGRAWCREEVGQYV